MEAQDFGKLSLYIYRYSMFLDCAKTVAAGAAGLITTSGLRVLPLMVLRFTLHSLGFSRSAPKEDTDDLDAEFIYDDSPPRRIPGRDGVPSAAGWALGLGPESSYNLRREEPLNWHTGRRALDEGIQAALALSDPNEHRTITAINSLPTQTMQARDKCFECSLCLSNVDVGDKFRVLGCKHAFHKQCAPPSLDCFCGSAREAFPSTSALRVRPLSPSTTVIHESPFSVTIVTPFPSLSVFSFCLRPCDAHLRNSLLAGIDQWLCKEQRGQIRRCPLCNADPVTGKPALQMRYEGRPVDELIPPHVLFQELTSPPDVRPPPGQHRTPPHERPRAAAIRPAPTIRPAPAIRPAERRQGAAASSGASSGASLSNADGAASTETGSEPYLRSRPARPFAQRRPSRDGRGSLAVLYAN